MDGGNVAAACDRTGIDPLWVEWWIEWRQNGRYPRTGEIDRQDGLFIPLMHGLLGAVVPLEAKRRDQERERQEKAYQQKARR